MVSLGVDGSVSQVLEIFRTKSFFFILEMSCIIEFSIVYCQKIHEVLLDRRQQKKSKDIFVVSLFQVKYCWDLFEINYLAY